MPREFSGKKSIPQSIQEQADMGAIDADEYRERTAIAVEVPTFADFERLRSLVSYGRAMARAIYCRENETTYILSGRGEDNIVMQHCHESDNGDGGDPQDVMRGDKVELFVRGVVEHSDGYEVGIRTEDGELYRVERKHIVRGEM